MTDATDGAAPRFKYRKLLFKKRWLTAGAVIVLVAGAWIAREPIADEFIRGELSGRDAFFSSKKAERILGWKHDA